MNEGVHFIYLVFPLNFFLLHKIIFNNRRYLIDLLLFFIDFSSYCFIDYFAQLMQIINYYI